MEGMVDIVRKIRAVNSEIPILVHANAGMPIYKDGETMFPETPEETASFVPALLQIKKHYCTVPDIVAGTLLPNIKYLPG